MTDEALDPHPCQTEAGDLDHDWKFQDDSFDHEFGVERIHYFRCDRCDETRPVEPGDYDDEPY
jgi:hypothetical protein